MPICTAVRPRFQSFFLNVSNIRLLSTSCSEEICRSCFSDLARIRDEANAGSWYRRPLPELSMGMTNDFEIAVEEGATIVRVGTAVFRDVDPFPATEVPPMRAEER